MLTRCIPGLGLALTVVGLINASGLFDAVATTSFLGPTTLHPIIFGIALALCSIISMRIDEKSSRPPIVDFLIAGFCIGAGLSALWRLYTRIGSAPHQQLGSSDLWLAFLGCAAVLLMTWRIWGAPLAAVGSAALLFFVTAQQSLSISTTEAIDVIGQVAGTIWFDADNGVLGWLLDVLLKTVMPFFLLGAFLADRLPPRPPIDLPPAQAIDGKRLTVALHAVGLVILPTLLVGALIMTERLGIGLPITLKASILPLTFMLAWFWLAAGIGQPRPIAFEIRIRDILLIVSAAVAFILAFSSGASPGESAIIALCIVMATSASNADFRRNPDLIIRPLARGGVAFGKVLIAAGTVGLIIAVLDRSGMPFDLAQILVSAAGEAQFPLLILAMMASIGLGTIMPPIAAYLVLATLIAPSLKTVGATELTFHLFVLLACMGASVLRSGIAAGANASIGAGIALIGVAFAFASNPELLLVPEALASVGRPDQAFDLLQLGSAVIRTGFMIYLVDTALSRLRRNQSGLAHAGFSIAAGIASAAADPLVYGSGVLGGIFLIVASSRSVGSKPKAA